MNISVDPDDGIVWQKMTLHNWTDRIMDAALTHWINSFAGISPVFDQMVILITQLGVPVIVALVMLQWWVRTGRQHVRHVAVCSGLAFLLGLAFNQVIILFVHRIRPYDSGVSQLLIDRSVDWSFPSDHATAAMAVAGAFIMQGLPKRALALFTMAALICLSRVYVGTHYVTDILGGAVTGLAAAATVHLAYREDSRLSRLVTQIL
jgi:undecaprenyl-diphosphatase